MKKKTLLFLTISHSSAACMYVIVNWSKYEEKRIDKRSYRGEDGQTDLDLVFLQTSKLCKYIENLYVQHLYSQKDEI